MKKVFRHQRILLITQLADKKYETSVYLILNLKLLSIQIFGFHIFKYNLMFTKEILKIL